MIRVPRQLWDQTVEHIRRCGGNTRECVVYWTGPADEPDLIDEAVHPEHIATPAYYEIADDWFQRFWVELDKRGRSVRVQVHTHGGSAFHSGTDDEGAIIQIPGYLSLVLPDFGTTDNSLDRAFLAQLDKRGRFVEVPIKSHLVFENADQS